MAKFPLRDICDSLTSAEDLEGVVDTMLAYLRAAHGDWHPTLALYDARQEAIVRVWQRERGRLDRRDLHVPVDHLPARLVRKFFKPSAFFNSVERRSLLTRVFRSSPVYEPDKFEAAQIQSIVAPVPWYSAVVLPLADQDDLIALLAVVSPKRGGIAPHELEEVLAVRTMAALAMARRLHASGRPTPESRAAEEHARRTAAAFQERLRQIEAESGALSEDNRVKAERMELLASELEDLRRRTQAERDEMSGVRERVHALEEQSLAAAAHLNDAYAQLANAQTRVTDLQRTTQFLRDVFEAASGVGDPEGLARELVQRFCEQFDVERCSLMRLDESDDQLRIAAYRGMDAGIAGRVRQRVGQGVAGWVAHHRKPVLVRRRDEDTPVAPTGVDSYNSDSFVSVPLVNGNRVLGVLNLSNKRDGESFDETDLERAQLAGSVLGLALATRPQARIHPIDGGRDDLRAAA